MVDAQDDDPEAPASQKGVTIHYIKSPQCIDVPVHGAYGGINPSTGAGHMALYSQRAAIPQEVVLEPDDSGHRKERIIAGRKGIIRTINAVLFYDINTAIAIHKWLGEKIKAFEDAHPELFKDDTKQ